MNIEDLHPKLQEFRTVYLEYMGRIENPHRLAIDVRENYEPHVGGDLPVTALIIGGKYAAFVQMGPDRNNEGILPCVCVERLKPHQEPNKTCICESSNPYFAVQLILMIEIQEWLRSRIADYKNRLFNR